MTKALIFDSGPLINFSMNGFLHLIEDLKKTFEGKFFITEKVKYEVIDRPIKIPRFELGALQIKNLLESKIIELPDKTEIDYNKLNKETIRLMEIANSYIMIGNKKINIISDGEASCLALSLELSKKGIENIIAIDERTTRILSEKPENLKKNNK